MCALGQVRALKSQQGMERCDVMLHPVRALDGPTSEGVSLSAPATSSLRLEFDILCWVGWPVGCWTDLISMYTDRPSTAEMKSRFLAAVVRWLRELPGNPRPVVANSRRRIGQRPRAQKKNLFHHTRIQPRTGFSLMFFSRGFPCFFVSECVVWKLWYPLILRPSVLRPASGCWSHASMPFCPRPSTLPCCYLPWTACIPRQPA